LTRVSCAPSELVRVLGLDPGSRITGWGLLVGNRHRVAAEGFGCLRPSRTLRRPAMLAWFSEKLDDLLRRTVPEVVVVETPFSSRNLRAGLALAETRGALLAVLGRWGGVVAEYEPARVKAAVVGNGRAEKRQVAYVIQHQLRLAEPPAEDAADALALALCHLRLGFSPGGLKTLV
jgi:crossover junction endodeoxyribonuclease RuvC